jgi:hypothetical protein
LRELFLLLALGVLMMAPARAAHAQDREQRACGRAGQPWVSVAFTGTAWTSELQSAVLADLRAGLQLSGITACVLGTAGSEKPLALLELDAAAEDRVAVGIALHDTLTAKRVQRDVDLKQVSSDARALALSAAAEELLRASWAELALQDAPPPDRPPPPEVQRAVRRSIAPARVGQRDVAIGARAAVVQHGGGLTMIGGELWLCLWAAQAVGIELASGLYEGLAEQGPHGAVDSRALGAAADAIFAIVPRGETVGLHALLGLALASVRVQGIDVRDDGTASEGAGIDVHAQLGLGASLAPWPALALRAEVSGGVPLRSVAAQDAGHDVASTAGIQLRAALGAEVRF